MPRQVFTAGEILTAANMNDLSDATVMVFDSSAARGSAIPTPAEGMVTYLKDTNLVEAFTGAAFEAVSQPSILQVVSTTLTSTFSTTSLSYTAVTGLAATITPSSASSKILIVVAVGIGLSSGGNSVNMRVSGGNATNYVGDASGSRARTIYSAQNYGDHIVPYSGNFLDSPNTTSPTTYQVEIFQTGTGVSCFVNRTRSDSDGTNFGRGASTITLMEVAG